MSSARTFDVIIAGAGSVGTPTAMYLAQAGFGVLVIEALPSCGLELPISTLSAAYALPTLTLQKYTYAQIALISYLHGKKNMGMISNGAQVVIALSLMMRTLKLT